MSIRNVANWTVVLTSAGTFQSGALIPANTFVTADLITVIMSGSLAAGSSFVLSLGTASGINFSQVVAFGNNSAAAITYAPFVMMQSVPTGMGSSSDGYELQAVLVGSGNNFRLDAQVRTRQF